jgi:hypothetical protein
MAIDFSQLKSQGPTKSLFMATLALCSQPKQGLARVRAKKEAR